MWVVLLRRLAQAAAGTSKGGRHRCAAALGRLAMRPLWAALLRRMERRRAARLAAWEGEIGRAQGAAAAAAAGAEKAEL